ncbi:hypothetical protein OAA91_01895 [Fibrobacterales bacterium]|nr:hypothetical protein [Fibrobacterales bacterium]
MNKLILLIITFSSLSFSNACREYFELMQYQTNTGFWGVGVTEIDSISYLSYKTDSISGVKTDISISEFSYSNGEVIKRDSSKKSDTLQTKGYYTSDGSLTTYLIKINDEEWLDTIKTFTTSNKLDSTSGNQSDSSFSKNNWVDRIYRQNDSLFKVSSDENHTDTLEVYTFENNTTTEYFGSSTLNVFKSTDTSCISTDNNFIEIHKKSWGWDILRKKENSTWHFQYLNKAKHLTPILKAVKQKSFKTFILPNGTSLTCQSKNECLDFKKRYLGAIF